MNSGKDKSPDSSGVRVCYCICPHSRIDEVINHKGPVFCEVVVDWHQNFAPKSSSKVLPDGKIVSAAVDDMAPFLDREEYESNHLA